jgi:SNF2 family DNA or RNA helicase
MPIPVLAACCLQAGRTQNVLPLLKKAKRAILLSGTPALNRPTELLTQLQGLLPKAAITKTAFEGRYAKIVDCGRFKKNVSGCVVG